MDDDWTRDLNANDLENARKEREELDRLALLAPLGLIYAARYVVRLHWSGRIAARDATAEAALEVLENAVREA